MWVHNDGRRKQMVSKLFSRRRGLLLQSLNIDDAI